MTDEQVQKAMTVSQNAARILEVLIECPDTTQRMAMLDEAFIPPDADGSPELDPKQVQRFLSMVS